MAIYFNFGIVDSLFKNIIFPYLQEYKKKFAKYLASSISGKLSVP